MNYALSDQERAILEAYRTEGTPAESRRAQIILLSEEAHTVAAIATEIGLSTSTVHQWRRKWKAQRLDIFPNHQEPDSIAVEAEPAAVETDSTAAAALDYAPLDQPAEIEVTDDSADADDVIDAIEADDASMDALDSLDADVEPIIEFDDIETYDNADDELASSELATATGSMGMTPDDFMAEAGRKAIYFHFERMLAHETGSRLGKDIEEVHDMRVATRRMRSAMRVFDPFFKTKSIRPFARALRRVARSLGKVRDLDVFIQKAQVFAEDHPEHDLTPLIKTWKKQRKNARRHLIRELDSERYANFTKTFAKFLITVGKGAKSFPKKSDPADYQVRRIAPNLIYECYDQIMAYEPDLADASLDTLHALRIDFKRFRYTLEFFEEVLEPEARQVINEVKIMQDHLGDLNDTQVVRASLRAFMNDYKDRYRGKAKAKRPDISGVKAYNKAKRAEQKDLLRTFPAAWSNFMRDEVKRNLTAAVAAL